MQLPSTPLKCSCLLLISQLGISSNTLCTLLKEKIMAVVHRVFSLVFVILFIASATASDAPSVDQQCATEASKLTECLGYASGQETSPTAKCCGSVTEIKGQDPACLCLVIRQAHGGSGGFSAFHLRLDRLLTLPKACALANASVSYCPKLLNLPPNSPDSAIFTNASYANSSTTTSANTESPSEAAMKLNYSDFLMIPLSVVFFLLFQIGA